MDKEELVRVIRILVYEGSREWVEKTLSMGQVPMNGRKVMTTRGVDNIVSSMTLREFPFPIERDLTVYPPVSDKDKDETIVRYRTASQPDLKNP